MQNQQQQQQAGLFRSGNVHPSMPGSENAHYLSAGNASASVQRPIGFNQSKFAGWMYDHALFFFLY